MTYAEFCQKVAFYGFTECAITETGFNELRAIGFSDDDLYGIHCDMWAGYSQAESVSVIVNGWVDIASIFTDLDSACAYLQGKIAQTDGGVAGIVFSDLESVKDWAGLSIENRKERLRAYLETEFAFKRES